MENAVNKTYCDRVENKYIIYTEYTECKWTFTFNSPVKTFQIDAQSQIQLYTVQEAYLK